MAAPPQVPSVKSTSPADTVTSFELLGFPSSSWNTTWTFLPASTSTRAMGVVPTFLPSITTTVPAGALGWMYPLVGLGLGFGAGGGGGSLYVLFLKPNVRGMAF